ncbi:MAG: hypothetical protein INQ03_16000 [Candidatus Heimdallarchaeota archaeon]|nr:hypothetical protein [Candidatus Heimdallarchaeota archaeon]
MNEEKKEEKKSSDGLVKRILKSQGPKILFLVLMIVDILLIIMRSEEFTPERPTLESENIIGFESVHFQIGILSAFLIVLIIYFFTRLLFVDQSDEFGITTVKSKRALLLLFLIIIFLLQVVILLDVALVNIYILQSLVSLIWMINDIFQIDPSLTSTDYLMYTHIRNNVFAILFALLMVFPLIMSVQIIYRIVKQRVTEENIQEVNEETDDKYYKLIFKYFIGLVIGLGVLMILYMTYLDTANLLPITMIMATIIVISIVLFTIMFIIVEIVSKILKVTSLPNRLVYPTLFLFYILPVLAWSAFDILTVISDGDLSKTIYASHELTDDVRNSTLQLYATTFLYNMTDIVRIIELDFVIVIGIGAVIIGFAEGFSVLSIGKALIKGKRVLRSGQVASTSTSSASAIRLTRLVFLTAWISMVWDKLGEIVNQILAPIDIHIDIDLRISNVFDWVYEIYSTQSNEFLASFALFLLPAVIIINSSLKFFSISLIAEKTKDNAGLFFLLTSSTFILIITQIYSDIVSIEIFESTFLTLLPLSSLSGSDMLLFAVNTFTNLEALSFYAGLFFVLLVAIPKSVFSKKKDDEVEKTQ